MKPPKVATPWTQFHDMHSGGGQKLEWARIYIQAPKEEAKRIFYARFGRNPERITCTCCGRDYSIHEHPSLEEATAYERGCAWVNDRSEEGGGHYEERGDPTRTYEPYRTLKEYLKDGSPGMLGGGVPLVIPEAEIRPEWRTDEARVDAGPARSVGTRGVGSVRGGQTETPAKEGATMKTLELLIQSAKIYETAKANPESIGIQGMRAQGLTIAAAENCAEALTAFLDAAAKCPEWTAVYFDGLEQVRRKATMTKPQPRKARR